jgi:hypothetical protein
LNGCFASDTVEILVGLPIEYEIQSEDESEINANDGFAWAIVSGGMPPYVFNWSNGSADSLISNLEPGMYKLSITDANGCQEIGSVVVNPGDCDEIAVYGTVVHPLCYDNCGSIVLDSVVGGTSPFSFEWSEGSTSSTVTDLCDDTYTLTITDINQCQQIESYTLIEPELLIVELSADSTFTYSGGTMPLADTTYSVTGNWLFINITDSNGCIATDSLMLVVVDEVSDIPIKVYPNPVREVLYLDCPTDAVLEQVKLVDIFGRVVPTLYNSTGREIDIRGIVEGCYLLLINGKGIQMVVPVVIVR